MVKNRKKPDKRIPGWMVGAATAIILCIGGIAVTAQLLLSQKIGEGSIEPIITIILLLSVLLGSRISAMMNPGEKLQQSAITVTAILCIMLIAGLSMDGRFQNPWLRIGAIVVGGLLSIGWDFKKKGKRPVRKKRYR